MINHLLLWFSILSFAIGFSAIVFTLKSYFKYRKKIILIYTIYLVAIAIEVIGTIFHIQYKNIHPLFYEHHSLRVIRLLIANIGLIIITFTIPIGIHKVLSIKTTAIQKKLFLFISSLICLLLVVEPFFLGNKNVINILCHFIEIPLFYSLMCYSLIVGIMYRNNTNDKRIKIALLLFTILTIPIFSYEFVIELFRLYIIESLPIPFYFLALNFFTIFFHLKDFNEPAYYLDNQPTNYFLDTYKISKREAEIITLIIEGLSNKEIADKLFISQKTVETHLGSCYKKTATKNRIQLYNLINRNQG